MKIFTPYILILSCLFVAVCVDTDFDEPPAHGVDPDLQANAFISDVKAYHLSGQIVELTEDMIIQGIVVADDESGNFYKDLRIQDETGGLAIRINDTDLYNEYPIGRRIFIKCKGLYISDYNGVIQIGGGIAYDDGEAELEGIAPVLINEFIVKGQWGLTVEPQVLTIDELGTEHISRLIRLEGVQFITAEVGQSYADADNFFSVNLTLEDCDEQTIILRSSGYSSFATELTPEGNGSVTAIYSVFGSDRQLFIRDVSDVVLEGERCGGSLGGGEISEDFSSESSNTDVSLDGWYNVSEAGTRLWQGKEFDGNIYAQATAYNDSNDEMIAWLITPAISLDEVNTLSFESAQAFYMHDGLSIQISSNFTGNPATADWETIDTPLAGSSSDDHDWVASDDIDLSNFSGTVHIGFRYDGNPVSGTTSYRLDNIQVFQKD